MCAYELSDGDGKTIVDAIMTCSDYTNKICEQIKSTQTINGIYNKPLDSNTIVYEDDGEE